ncbi:hypothetical protein LL033_09925 [Clostridium estertheticum]|uniref:hypothetical protein n=1 Tax=Clostridium estertheticum TaxID=238834 RepID=UPI00227AD0C0|nr:hypothetical protein [Clostridium estertheticum]WAG57474.1 hypothetical protein LL033_09925 [Clostridium estertheticum]
MNLIKNRHLVAHETYAPAMIFTEVVCLYEKSNIIIDRIKQIIFPKINRFCEFVQ